MYDLLNFTVGNVLECTEKMRGLSKDITTMEEAANKIALYFYDNFVDKQNEEKECALVRLYKTHSYGELEPMLRILASKKLKVKPTDTMKCLTLLATVGENPEWNSRKQSINHQVIPLPNKTVVEQLPMVTQLFKQLGMDINILLKPDLNFTVEEHKFYNVFYVPDAVGSPYIPAQQDFVIPYKIKSVLGFGSNLPSGNFFAVILFAKVSISKEVADLFRSIALSIRGTFLPFDIDNRVFS